MLHALELENFKAFGQRAHIPFAPITLIFGENSSGKSTILQALNLLKQTRESRETGVPLLPRTENGIVDLGSFQELIFDHDLKQTLSIHAETTVRRSDIRRLPYRENKIAIEFSFKKPSLKEDILLHQIEVYFGQPTRCIAKFQPSGTTEETEESTSDFNRVPRPFLPSKLTEAKCVWLTKEVEYWQPEFEQCKKNKPDILRQLEERMSYLTAQKGSNTKIQEDDKDLQEALDFLVHEIEFYSSDFDLKTYISKRHKEEMGTVLGLQSFLPVGTRQTNRNPIIPSNRPLVRQRYNDMVFDVNQLTMAASNALDRTLAALFPMGPFRRPPERLYIFRGTSPQDVGHRGDLLPDLLFRRPKLVREANKWLRLLGIGYELEVKSVGDRSRDLFEIRLIDNRRKESVNVALPDVGFGISQLLPFVVQSLVSKEQIISIEQPEVHVHPRLQADLGDLLAEAIKEPRRNQFIVETHSEHLILRLQRLVRKREIKPKDVSVIYVSRGPEGAKAERLRLDEDGDFIDEWPNGFFLERLNELR